MKENHCKSRIREFCGLSTESVSGTQQRSCPAQLSPRRCSPLTLDCLKASRGTRSPANLHPRHGIVSEKTHPACVAGNNTKLDLKSFVSLLEIPAVLSAHDRSVVPLKSQRTRRLNRRTTFFLFKMLLHHCVSFASGSFTATLPRLLLGLSKSSLQLCDEALFHVQLVHQCI